MEYLYNKYLDWSEYYRNQEANQYQTTLYPYPRKLDPIKEDKNTAKVYPKDSKDTLAQLYNPYHRP